MKKKATIKAFLTAGFILLLGTSVYFLQTVVNTSSETDRGQGRPEKLLAELENSLKDGEDSTEQESGKFKKARYEYFHKLLRDPATNSIPENNRSREISFARTLPNMQQLKANMSNSEAAQVEEFAWSSAGPTNIGGRTRALGIDRRNSDIIIAGAVSGGIWKSTDGGDTWDLKTPDAENFSVTSLVQDTVNQDTWYYTSGEFIANSASAEGAPYFGTGIFRSTDNGETWTKISSTDDDNGVFDSQFDFMSRIRIHPSGTVYAASNGFGILRSPGGNDFSNVELGGAGHHAYADVAIASNGKIVAALSSRDASADPVDNEPGIFLSENDGGSWTEITPSEFPDEYERSVVTFAPSNPDIVYLLTHVGITDPENTHQEDNRLFRLNLGTGTETDLTQNIPNFRGSVGQFWTQGGYDMEIAVKPDNENFVLIGGTNLFRGRNGFSSSPSGGYNATNANEFWIGGYTNENSPDLYPNQHPDQHIIKFDPDNPDRMWVGHDGGLSVTDDITASRVSWTSKNNSYITTQFYTSAIPALEDDNRLMGGTQDNGTPFFRYESAQTSNAPSVDISFGDGGHAFFTQSHFYVSRQNGSVIRYNVSPDGNIAAPFAFVFPADAENQEFIHPYTIDPNDQSIMYYPGGNQLWRTLDASTLENEDADGVTTGFTNLTSAALPGGYTISALEVSQTPENILYYAGSALDETPIIKRLENASYNNSSPEDISIPAVSDSSWVIDIAVNPVDANEVIAVMSNYNIMGLFHTTDGGQNWTSIEGNLTGNSNNLGPSLRSAVMVPSDEGTAYVLGTSTGLYTASSLDGSNTDWGQVAVDQIGNTIVSHLSSRVSDGDIAAATHGRGMYLGNFQGVAQNPRMAAGFALHQNFPNPFSSNTVIEYDLPVESIVTISVYDILGRKVRDVVYRERKASFERWRVNVEMQGLASGTYIYRLEAVPVTDTVSTFRESRKMTYIK